MREYVVRVQHICYENEALALAVPPKFPAAFPPHFSADTEVQSGHCDNPNSVWLYTTATRGAHT